MPRLTPDHSFYPSPTMAMAAEPETLAYVAMLNPDPQKPDALAVVDLDPESRRYGQLVGQVDMPAPATSCITSAGTPAARACARTRRIRTWSGATWSCRACARRASTSSTPSRIRGSRRS